jgi:hypothetical protein
MALVGSGDRLVGRRLTTAPGPVVDSTRDYADQFGGGPTEVIALADPARNAAGTPSSKPHATFPHRRLLRKKKHATRSDTLRAHRTNILELASAGSMLAIETGAIFLIGPIRITGL